MRKFVETEVEKVVEVRLVVEVLQGAGAPQEVSNPKTLYTTINQHSPKAIKQT